jgi:hypothetical protein
MTDLLRLDGPATAAGSNNNSKKLSLLEVALHATAESVFGKGTITDEITRYVPHALSTAALFFPGHKALGVAMGLGILNEVKQDSDLSTAMIDGVLGASKAGLTKVAFEKLGPMKNLGGVELNAATKGIVLGGASRVIGDTFTRENYFDSNGNFDLQAGMNRVSRNAFSGHAIALDAVLN